MKKMIYMILGCFGVGMGAVGAIIPVLPTFPFLMLAAFCFARSSEKLHNWFVGTKLYKDNLADFVAGKGMTKKTKIRIMMTVTALMSIGFLMMGLKGIVTGCNFKSSAIYCNRCIGMNRVIRRINVKYTAVDDQVAG